MLCVQRLDQYFHSGLIAHHFEYEEITSTLIIYMQKNENNFSIGMHYIIFYYIILYYIILHKCLFLFHASDHTLLELCVLLSTCTTATLFSFCRLYMYVSLCLETHLCFRNGLCYQHKLLYVE